MQCFSALPKCKIKKKLSTLHLTHRQAANLKGWLKTPQDWARFNSWASVNARPRVVKEPPPICRESRSLLKLQKSIDRLSRPKRNFCQALVCRVPQISKHALKAKASTRILCLSLPNVRLTDEGRSPQWKVSRAAMSYCPSDRITELSQPKLRLEYAEPCIQWRKLSRRALLRYSASARERQLARAKNFADSPGVLSQQERRALYTPYGTKKSALCYELCVNLCYRETISKFCRGLSKFEKVPCYNLICAIFTKSSRILTGEPCIITPWMSLLALPKYSALKDKRSETAMKWKKQIVEESPIRSKQAFREYKMRYCLSSLGTGASGDASESRKKRQNAWRYAPPVCHPLSNVIKRSVLNYKASERTICLAMPKERKDIGCRKNPFSVRKGALNVTSTTRVNQLATAPPRKCRPSVPKKPPLKKDKYGRVLYQKAPFGKKLPKVPRYKERECTPKELEEMKKKREMLRRSACRSMKESTVDPLFDLSRAEKQKKERDRCKRILAARREKKLKGKKETREAEVDE
ncbi:uncharacterized protein [Prorops nasuta]|uniref:uncharacterized protein n=1 Tax=Prorops nasuta TaxID=863751 RepID=UPI0034CE7869